MLTPKFDKLVAKFRKAGHDVCVTVDAPTAGNLYSSTKLAKVGTRCLATVCTVGCVEVLNRNTAFKIAK